MDPAPAAHLNRHATVVLALLLLALPAWAAWTWLPQRYPHACAVLGCVPGMDAVLADRHLADAARLLAAHNAVADGDWRACERRRTFITDVVFAGLEICARHPLSDPDWMRRYMGLMRVKTLTNHVLRQMGP
ncbi:MAG: hypothetical protein H0X38_13570 [Planctomycetes bacterium]|nr:hypothetical protein [Planctomycetota bacterium]